MECPIARSAEQIGDGWSLLLVRNALLGARTFQDFEERLGIPSSTLARRLTLLCEQGLLERRQYAAHPPRDEYVLTEKGLDLLPVLLSMAVWGNRWLAPRGEPLTVVDPATGEPVEPVLIDARTGRRLGPGDVAVVPGPGASKALKRALSAPVVFAARSQAQEQEDE